MSIDLCKEKAAAPMYNWVEMTAEETDNGCKSLSINYSFETTEFGDILIASTGKGICSLEFADNHDEALKSLHTRFPNASITDLRDDIQRNALSYLLSGCHVEKPTTLHIKGTIFQRKVWKALLEIPIGFKSSYGEIASKIGNPKAGRAVGTAVGQNPVSLLIPCHRVIRSSGEIGNYRWGSKRKKMILEWEAR